MSESPSSVRVPVGGLTRQLDNDNPRYVAGDPGVYLTLALAYDSLAAPSCTVDAEGVSTPCYDHMSPRLAEAWHHEGGGRWSVRLRRGVRSHAGHELQAEDIAWTFAKAFALGTMGAWRWGDVAGIADESHVRAVDRYTVSYDTWAENPNFPAYLLYVTPNIVDSQEIRRHASPEDPWGLAWLNDNVAGFGPYALEAFDSSGATFRARDDYWAGRPAVDSVELVPVAAREDALSMLESGEPTVALGLDADETARAMRIAGADLRRTWAGHLWVQIDFTAPPFDDMRVRQALCYATPYAEVRERALLGFARPWRSPVKGVSPWYTGRHWPYETDAAKARELLAAAGVGDGFATEMYIWRRPDCERTAIVLQDAWRAIGVDLGVRYVDELADGITPPLFLSHDCAHNLSEPLYDLVHDYAPLHPLFPEPAAEHGVCTWKPHFIRNDEVVEQLRTAIKEPDPERKARQVDDLQRHIVNFASGILLAEQQEVLAARNVPASFYAEGTRLFQAVQYQNAKSDFYLPRHKP